MLIIVESDKTQHGIKSEVITLNFSDGTGVQLSVHNLKRAINDFLTRNVSQSTRLSDVSKEVGQITRQAVGLNSPLLRQMDVTKETLAMISDSSQSQI